MYVHADHLGIPQKMTDGSQTLVWDAVYQPFGETHSITGTALNNQRFPGQYFDQESGFSYNYFRDYDSTTGRYVQSDPIGLEGGLNTFSYVAGNPITRIDPFGLIGPEHIPNFGKKCLVLDGDCFLKCTSVFDTGCDDAEAVKCQVYKDKVACARCGSSAFDLLLNFGCLIGCTELKEGCECKEEGCACEAE